MKTKFTLIFLLAVGSISFAQQTDKAGIKKLIRQVQKINGQKTTNRGLTTFQGCNLVEIKPGEYLYIRRRVYEKNADTSYVTFTFGGVDQLIFNGTGINATNPNLLHVGIHFKDDIYVSSFPPYPEVKADESFQLTVFVDDKFTRKDLEQLFISLNNKVNIITL